MASKNSGDIRNELGIIFWIIEWIFFFGRNTPDDNTEADVSMNDLIEIMNQAAIWIAKKDYKKDFWLAESFLKVTLPNWKKWQKA